MGDDVVWSYEILGCLSRKEWSCKKTCLSGCWIKQLCLVEFFVRVIITSYCLSMQSFSDFVLDKAWVLLSRLWSFVASVKIALEIYK